MCILWKPIYVSWYIISINPGTFLCIQCIRCEYIILLIVSNAVDVDLSFMYSGSCIIGLGHGFSSCLHHTDLKPKSPSGQAEGEMAGCDHVFGVWEMEKGHFISHAWASVWFCAISLPYFCSQLSKGWDVVSKVLNIGYQDCIGWWGFFISDIGYRGRYRGYARISAFISNTLYNEILITKSWFRVVDIIYLIEMM